ncbi:MAG: DNA polymerase [Pseudomonadota bacterium]
MQVRDVDTLARVLPDLGAAPVLAVDLETTGLDPLVERTLLIGLSDGRRTWLIEAREVPADALRTLLGPVLQRTPLVVMHNARFDLRFLLRLGIRVDNPVDTLLNQQLLENGRERGRLSLAEVCRRMLGVTVDKSERISFTTMGDQAFTEAQLEYLRRDLLATYQLFRRQVVALAHDGLAGVAAIEANAINAFASMEQAGLPVDVAAWRTLTDQAERARGEARKVLDSLFREVADLDLFRGVNINYDSEQELKEHLRRLGIELESTARPSLLGLEHPVGRAIIDYREAAKIVSTYGEGFLSHVHPVSGRIHARFRQIGASTGRVSCSDPNLQNIPKESAFRASIRAPEGRTLVTADYAACELRILAQASGDQAFVHAFARGDDLHAMVASQMFGKPVSKTENPELRNRAKAINFGLVYGMGAGGLAQAVGCGLDEAERLLTRYFDTYPAVKRYLEQRVQIALREGHATTLSGRRLWFSDEDLRAPDAAGRIGRVAKNMPIQGTSADITKLAMAHLFRRLQDEQPEAQIVNCVHDEIVVETSDGEHAARLVTEAMEQAERDLLPDVVPAVEVVVDRSWAKG